MRIYQEIKKCFRSVFIHRLRAFLSLLGILFGVGAVIAMLSIGEGAKQETLEQIEQLGMHSILIRYPIISDEQHAHVGAHAFKELTEDEREALREHIPGLLHLAALKVITASIKDSFNPFTPEILATTRAYGEIKDLKLAEGRFLCDVDQTQKKLVCVLGGEVAKMLGKKGHVGESIRLDNVHYEVIGVLHTTQWKESKNQMLAMHHLDKMILIPLATAPHLRQGSPILKNSLSEIILHLKDASHMQAAVPLIKNMLRKKYGDEETYQVIIPQELIQQAYRTQRTFNLVLGNIAAISLLVGGIGIMNIMLATVSERTCEIGIRRAVGASQRHILLQFY